MFRSGHSSNTLRVGTTSSISWPSSRRYGSAARLSNAGSLRVYFAITPRRKIVGLFKGEIWVDSSTYLPLYEKGRFVRNPSIFFKRIEFERSYAHDSGVPVRTASVIRTRLVGKVELNVSYSHFAPILAQADPQNTLPMEGAEPAQPSLAAHVNSDPYTPRE